MATTQSNPTPRARKQAAENTDRKSSAMEMARSIFQRVNSKDYKPTEKSVRQEFLKLAQSEAKLTPSGASTYWQNLSNEQKGEALYKYSRRRDDSTPRRRPGRPARNQQSTQSAPQPIAKIGEVEVVATPEILAAAHQLVAAEQALVSAVSAARG